MRHIGANVRKIAGTIGVTVIAGLISVTIVSFHIPQARGWGLGQRMYFASLVDEGHLKAALYTSPSLLPTEFFAARVLHNEVVTGPWTHVLTKEWDFGWRLPYANPLNRRTNRVVRPGLKHSRCTFLRCPLHIPLSVIVSLLAVPILRRRIGSSLRRYRGLCVNCGYDLRGAVSAQCSECGLLTGSRKLPLSTIWHAGITTYCAAYLVWQASVDLNLREGFVFTLWNQLRWFLLGPLVPTFIALLEVRYLCKYPVRRYGPDSKPFAKSKMLFTGQRYASLKRSLPSMSFPLIVAVVVVLILGKPFTLVYTLLGFEEYTVWAAITYFTIVHVPAYTAALVVDMRMNCTAAMNGQRLHQ